MTGGREKRSAKRRKEELRKAEGKKINSETGDQENEDGGGNHKVRFYLSIRTMFFSVSGTMGTAPGLECARRLASLRLRE